MAPSLSIAPPQPAQPKRLGAYVVHEAVPILDEHVDEDGVRYDRELLQHVANNCNRRIKATGDWCPVIIGHTTDEPGAPPPPVIGFAGPFWVAPLDGGFGIYANFWIFRDSERAWRAYPRRSVEIWPEDQPQNRFVDPIALLGGETPRRDLGIAYSKACARGKRRPVIRTGRRLRYSTVAGQFNTFTPAPTKNAKGTTMLSQDDLQQIVAAVGPMIDEKIEAANALRKDVGKVGDDAELGLDDDLGLGDDEELDILDAEGGDMLEAPDAMPPTGDMGGAPVEPMPAAGEGPPPAIPDTGGDAPVMEPPEEDEEAVMQYGKSLCKYMRRYSKDGELDDDGRNWWEQLTDEDRGSVKKYACGEGADADDRKLYSMASGEDVDMMADAAEVEQDIKPGSAIQYARQRDGWKRRYQKARQTVAKYKKQAQEAQKYAKQAAVERRRALRSRDVMSLMLDGYVIAADVVDESINDGWTDERWLQFTTKTVPQRYQKMPTQMIDFGHDTENLAQRYSKGKADDTADRARTIALKLRERGISDSYKTVRQNLADNGGTYKPPSDAHAEAVNGAARAR